MGVPAPLAASWRLAWVEIIQIPPFLYTVLRDSAHSWADYRKSMPLMALSGICLGLHFSAWVLSLQMTSLTQSLLWVSMGPIILNLFGWAMYLKSRGSMSPPSTLESLGAVTGVLGSAILLMDSGIRSDSSIVQPSWQGDLVAFSGAVTVSLYLTIGRELREWMPLWTYTFAVKGFAYLTSIALAICSDESLTWGDCFGFLKPKYLLPCFYLGLGPGILGHTLLNGLLRYLSPLTVSTAMLSEPIVGGLIGYLFGMQDIPGVPTWIGGTILLVGLFLVLAGESPKGHAASEEETVLLLRKELYEEPLGSQ